MQDLIDVKPAEGSSYVRSLTEPFNDEMIIKDKQIKNWFVHFGVINCEDSWHQVHVSGHGDGEQIKHVVEDSKSKKLIPIHTDKKNDQYHRKWHSNVTNVNQHEVVKI